MEPVAEPVVDPVVELPLEELLGLDALAVSLELPADTFVRMNCWLLLEALDELPLPDVPVAPIDPDPSAGFTHPVSVIDFESLDDMSELLELDGV